MAITDLIQEFSFNDGALRRKLISGLIVVSAIVVADGSLLAFTPGELTSLLSSPVVALLLVLVIYIVGTIVELIGEQFLVRSVGATMWMLTLPIREIRPKSKTARILIWVLLYLFAIPIAAYIAAFVGLFGVCPYREDPNKVNDPRAIAHYRKLPATVQRGLVDPFGEYFDLAWHQIAIRLDPPSNRFLLRRVGRIRDVLAITTALVLGAFALLASLSFGKQSPSPLAQLSMFALILSPAVLFYGYMLILRSGIRNCIELSALASEAKVD